MKRSTSDNRSKLLSLLTGSVLTMALAMQMTTARAQEENPVIKNRNASSFDRPVSPIYTGRSPYFEAAPREPAPAPRVVAAPRPAPAPAPAPVIVGDQLVRISKRAPATGSVGEDIPYELTVTATADAADVVVVDSLSANASYVRSEPQATPEGNRLVWRFPRMARGETKTIMVLVKANAEGELVNCATVTAVPVVCVSTMIGKPKLTIEKTGPETAQLGSDVTYNIVVKNTGTTTAKGVVVNDAVPQGFSHAGGQSALSFNVGDLAPGASKSIPVTFKANQRGKICNVAEAVSSNAGKVSDDACTLITQPGVKIVKTTTDNQLLINRTATYNIEVSNTGDVPLTGVVVTDTVAPETTIVEAVGGSASGNTATWNVGELKAGEKKSLTVKINSRNPGRFCNTAAVSTAQGLRDSSQACTEWLGVTGVLVEVVDDPDPIQVGETTTFTIRVTNQGSSRNIEELGVKAIFPAETSPTTASSGGTVAGKQVTWPVVPTLAPKQSVTYTIQAKGVTAGDSRLKVEVITRLRQNPIEEVESTTIY